MRNFKSIDEPDDDFAVQKSQRVIVGQLTKKRYLRIKRYAKAHTNTAPYGRSESGHAYRCGHDYDCCGCLCSERMYVDYKPHWKGHKVTLTFVQSFNY